MVLYPHFPKINMKINILTVGKYNILVYIGISLANATFVLGTIILSAILLIVKTSPQVNYEYL